MNVECSSKHDGLAGTRFGWGLVKDKDLAQRMFSVVSAITLALSADIELRILNSMQTILGECHKQLLTRKILHGKIAEWESQKKIL